MVVRVKRREAHSLAIDKSVGSFQLYLVSVSAGRLPGIPLQRTKRSGIFHVGAPSIVGVQVAARVQVSAQTLKYHIERFVRDSTQEGTTMIKVQLEALNT